MNPKNPFETGKIVPIDEARERRRQREAEKRDLNTADVELTNSLIAKMQTSEEYDLLIVKHAKETIDAFKEYIEVFKIYRFLDEIEQYEIMMHDLEEALARYERRDK